MQQRRPTSVLVIAIFHFILGGLGLMCNLCNMANLIVGGGGASTFGMKSEPRQAQMQRDMEKAMEQAAPLAKPVKAGDSIISLCYAGLLLVAGFGLLQMAPWGRALSLLYGVLALVVNLAVALYTILVMLPAMGAMLQPLLAQANNAQERQLFEMIITWTKVVTFVTVLIPLIYPFIVLVVMNTATVKNAFGGGESSSLGDDREEGFPSNEPFRPGPDDRFKA